jgi:uncharacterized protein
MPHKLRRGFAAMDPEERRAIARLGGQAAHDSGNAHEFTREETLRGGKIGGWVVSRDRKHMARIARIGVEARRRKRHQEKSRADKKTVRK